MDVTWDLITRALYNSITQGEEQMLREWLAESSRHRLLWQQLILQKMDLDSLTDEEDQTHQWILLQKRLQDKSTMTLVGKDPVIPPGKLPLEAGSTKVRWLNSAWLKIAAVSAAIFIIVFFSRSFLLPAVHNHPDGRNLVTIEAPGTTTKKVLLPDGSSVWLHYHSRIRYDSSSFSKKERAIELDGDAFFDIAQNKNAPFVIRTRHFQTEVLGTSFGMYARDNELQQVTVATGSVLVMTGGRKEQLSAGTALTYNTNTKRVTLHSISTGEASALQENRIYFVNDSLGSITQKLQYWYHRKISLAAVTCTSGRSGNSGTPGVAERSGNQGDRGRHRVSGTQKQVSFTGIIQDDGMENVLNGLGYLAGFTYSINDDEIIIYPQP